MSYFQHHPLLDLPSEVTLLNLPDGRVSGHPAVPTFLAEGSGDRREPVPGAGAFVKMLTC